MLQHRPVFAVNADGAMTSLTGPFEYYHAAHVLAREAVRTAEETRPVKTYRLPVAEIDRIISLLKV